MYLFFQWYHWQLDVFCGRINLVKCFSFWFLRPWGKAIGTVCQFIDKEALTFATWNRKWTILICEFNQAAPVPFGIACAKLAKPSIISVTCTLFSISITNCLPFLFYQLIICFHYSSFLSFTRTILSFWFVQTESTQLTVASTPAGFIFVKGLLPTTLFDYQEKHCFMSSLLISSPIIAFILLICFSTM